MFFYETSIWCLHGKQMVILNVKSAHDSISSTRKIENLAIFLFRKLHFWFLRITTTAMSCKCSGTVFSIDYKSILENTQWNSEKWCTNLPFCVTFQSIQINENNVSQRKSVRPAHSFWKSYEQSIFYSHEHTGKFPYRKACHLVTVHFFIHRMEAAHYGMVQVFSTSELRGISKFSSLHLTNFGGVKMTAAQSLPKFDVIFSYCSSEDETGLIKCGKDELSRPTVLLFLT